MATINKTVRQPPVVTHEGGRAVRTNPVQQLRRSVLACMLWESTFYESGEEIADRIASLVAAIATSKEKAQKVLDLALEARTKFKLRHAPLLLVREVARVWKWGSGLDAGIAAVIQRADELAELVSIYWKGKKQPLTNQIKRGLALAFGKFSAYDLAKYDRAKAVRLRDVLFLTHPKPKDTEQEGIWKGLVDGTLPTPDTWETRLSSGADKKEAWTALLAEKKLGALALLRNLRNIEQAGIPVGMVREALGAMRVERVLPYRFVAAERAAPTYSRDLETAMFKCVEKHEKLPGTTVLLVDVSGSMDGALSAKSDMTRIDAAGALAILLNEIGDARVFTFSNSIVQVPNRRGFGLRDAINASQPHSGTNLGGAVTELNRHVQADRLIVITDEQAHDTVPKPSFAKAYVVNVAPYKNGVGYGAWTHIDGFSEAIVDYILESERASDGTSDS